MSDASGMRESSDAPTSGGPTGGMPTSGGPTGAPVRVLVAEDQALLRASLADRVVWINAVGLFAVATVFTVTAWEQGLRFPLALALIAVNSPLVTMISGDPDLARQLTMLGRPALAWWHYAAAVAVFLGTFNVGVGVVCWRRGARDLPLLAGFGLQRGDDVGAATEWDHDRIGCHHRVDDSRYLVLVGGIDHHVG